MKGKTRGRIFVYAILALLACVALDASATAQASQPRAGGVNKTRPKISLRQARATALAKVPGGRIKSSELEVEGGKLIYSFDINKSKGRGIEEVNIDAISGEVVGVEHETPKHEAIERRDERKESRRKKP